MNKNGATRELRNLVLSILCAISLAAMIFVGVSDRCAVARPFAANLTAIEEWQLTDSKGNRSAIRLPYTISYGEDGLYSLDADIPAREDATEATLQFYSNYVDCQIYINGEAVYAYPAKAPAFGGTGNTFHYVTLPKEGAHVQVRIRCQLGKDITYLLRAPIVGSEAAMLYGDLRRSLLPVIIASCLFILAASLIFLKRLMRGMAFARKVDLGCFGAFMMLFSLYILMETELAEIFIPSSRFVYMSTFLLLILIPIPIFTLFMQYLSPRYQMPARVILWICYINFALQTALHFLNVIDLRAMMPATHAVIILGMVVLFSLMLKSGREAALRALTALPMMLGGGVDILLLALNTPSFHNNLFFIIGVTAYILIQFGAFTRAYLRMYHNAIEGEILHTMAYTDMLTGLKNRNAYERKLRALSENAPPAGLGCIVADVNGLKQINDTFGHSAGDASLVETGEALRMLVPETGESFRTGGDEFVVLISGATEEEIARLSASIAKEAFRRGQERGLSIVLALGYGLLRPEDGAVPEFIRRIDTQMYQNKQKLKCEGDYPSRLRSSNAP